MSDDPSELLPTELLPTEHRPACRCKDGRGAHDIRRVVLTGGPGAGKTAVLEVVRRRFCEHVVVMPEAATIVFAGGFPRRPSHPARRHAQLAIFHVQDQMERIEVEESRAALVLCDRGIVDALAYWPGDPEEFWRATGTTHAEALARYAAVIHLRTPPLDHGYARSAVRIETAEEAARIDERIAVAWGAHPNVFVVDSTDDFVLKLRLTIEHIASFVPSCCRPPST